MECGGHSVHCKVWSADVMCRVQRVKCKVRSVKCGVFSAEWKM